MKIHNKNSLTPNLHEFERQAQHVLRYSERQLSEATTRRLAEARSQAIKTATEPKNHRRFIPETRYFMPAAGMAMASIIALVLLVSPSMNDQRHIIHLSQDETLLSENIDLYEDMDFYSWLADNSNNLKG